MIISKEFRFEAAHQLPDEEIFGNCRNLHGHSYILYVEVDGEVNSKGWVMNFKTLKSIVNKLFIEKYDHWFLNDYYTISTAEYMAQYIFNTIHDYFIQNDHIFGEVKINEVKLYETATSYAKCVSYKEIPEGIVKDHSVIKNRDRIKVFIKD